MKRLLCICLAAFAFASPAATRTYRSDFVPGGAAPEGWEEDGDGYGRTLPNEVLSVEVFADGGAVSVAAGADEASVAEVGRLCAPATGAVFRLPQSAGVRFVSLSSAGLLGCAVETADTRIPSPANLRVHDVAEDSLSVSWDAVEGAAGYRVQLFTNALVGASAGTVLWRETFARVTTNSPAAKTGFAMDAFRALADTAGADWDGVLVFPYDHADGAVRVGNSSSPGWLATPPLPSAGDATLHFTAWRYDSSPDATNRASKAAFYDVGRVSGTSTNILASVRLTTTPTNAVLPLSDWREGDRVVFRSATNAAAYRLAVDEAELRTGHRAGAWTPVLCGVMETGGTTAAFEGLPTAEVTVSVTALAARAADDSPAATAAVDLANPPAAVALRAFPLDGTPYSENFDCLTGVVGKTAWRNCATVPFWQAFLDHGEGDVEPAGEVNQNAGKTTTGGLYAWHGADGAADSYALGSLARGDCGFVLGVAFRNAMETTVAGLTASFTAEQWNFRRGTKTVPFEWLVTNEIVSVAAEGDWRAVDAAAFTTLDADAAGADAAVPRAERMAAEIPAGLPPGEYLLLRWTDAAKASSCPFAVDDVELRYEAKAAATLITIR